MARRRVFLPYMNQKLQEEKKKVQADEGAGELQT
jgi:hypothetical protein